MQDITGNLKMRRAIKEWRDMKFTGIERKRYASSEIEKMREGGTQMRDETERRQKGRERFEDPYKLGDDGGVVVESEYKK